MTFLYPLGLLGLIGIPVLILIYILQSKYTEQTVPSTYLWRLSEKFLKRRNPLSGLTGLIGLILEILIIALISLAIARPTVILPGEAKSYHFILDASSSMSAEEDGTTLFENAKREIEEVIDGSVDGSLYSLTLVSGNEITAFSEVSDKDTAIKLLSDVRSDHTALERKVLVSAAQEIFDGDPSKSVYVLTDMYFDGAENVTLLTFGAKGRENYAISGLEYSHMGGKLTASADLTSYVGAADMTVRLTVDGVKTDAKLSAGGEALSSDTVPVKGGETVRIELTADVETFDSLTLEIVNADGYLIDNSVTAHNLEADKAYSVLIVSETGFFLSAASDALLNSDVKLIDPDDYENEEGEYGLYIFEGYTPSELPNGSVWLVNCDKNIESSGFDVRAKVELPKADVIERSTSSATATRALLDGVTGKDIYITSYIKYSGMYRKFQTLFSYDGNPIIFAGTNGVGARQVVFGFDLSASDFALSVDFITLLENLMEYSFPDVIDEGSYTVGDALTVNILPNATDYRAKSPSDRDVFIDTEGASAELPLDEVGTYTVYVTVSENEVPYKVFAAADTAESDWNGEGGGFTVSGERKSSELDGKFDPTILIFIVLSVLFIADWGLYCYEKYQLR